MSVETEYKFTLPGAYYAEKIMSEDYVARYIKDDYKINTARSVYYDTEDWSLNAHDYTLRVRESGGSSVVALKHGRIDTVNRPGFFRSEQFLCSFNNAETVVDDLLDKGAPRELADIVGGRPLSPCFTFNFTRRSAVLYLPDMLRAELCFESGILDTGNKAEPLEEMTVELLFGDEDGFVAYCKRFLNEMDLSPVLLTRQQYALRLLRSR
ncbi:MAG: CYTH domain-containing protein [Clostridiales bacterium]|nr:CYTH domain-containing protein [Clostridiales bacterium]